MKKLYIIFLALILILAMILPMALPVATANPNVLGYVSGLSYGGTDVQPMMGFGGNLKLLSDGTIVGHWNLRIFKSFDETAFGLPQDFFADTEWELDLTEVSTNHLEPYPGLSFGTYFDDEWAALWGIFKCVSNNHKVLNEPFPGQYHGGIIWGCDY